MQQEASSSAPRIAIGNTSLVPMKLQQAATRVQCSSAHVHSSSL